MSNILKTDDVDIYSFPEPVALNDYTDITIGDLHGNAITFLHFLLRYGICQIGNEPFEQLVALYETPIDALMPWERKDWIEEYNTLIAQLTVLRQDVLIRLIGDEVSDRGKNDYFVLKILQKLHEGRAKYEILSSNHGFSFVESYENYKENNTFDSLHVSPCTSLKNMSYLVQEGVISPDEIMHIVNTCYKPHLKVISYSLDKETDGITIYSHAGIDLETIAALADQFDVTYKDESREELARTIDQINQNYSDYVENEIVQLLPASGIYPRKNSELDNPLMFTIWNRNHDILNRPGRHSEYNYLLTFIHGHDSTDLTENNIINLDNTLGKEPGSHMGQSRIYLSDDVQLNQQEKNQSAPSDAAQIEEDNKAQNCVIHKTSLFVDLDDELLNEFDESMVFTP